jgi:hypothetical protein
VKRDAEIPRARQHRRPEVRLTRAQRASDAEQELPVPGGRAQGEHHEAGLGVDEDLVPGGRSQRRTALAQGICHADEPHRVDCVVGERGVSWIGRVQPGERIPQRVCVPARVRADPVRLGPVHAETTSVSAMLIEVDEDAVLKHSAEARRVAEQRRGHSGLAVTDREGCELAQDDVPRHCKGGTGGDGVDARDDRSADLEQPCDDVVHRPGERDVRGVDRMDATTGGRRVAHPHIVEIGDQSGECRDELPAIRRPRGQQQPVDGAGELERTGRDIARVDRPVVAEQRVMRVGHGDERLVDRDGFQRRPAPDRIPEALLEDRPDLLGEGAVDRGRRRLVHRLGHPTSVGTRPCPHAGATG